jgi:hypothetical protein
MSLTPLSRYRPPPYRPKVLVIIVLMVVALLDATSMLLKWVGVFTSGGSYVIANGLQQASWVLVVAAVVIALAVRLSLGPPTGFVRCAFVGLDFFVLLGLYIEYVNNLGRAESNTTTPYLGPGFFLALGATALLIAATVVGWRERDNWPGALETPAPRTRR